MCACKAFGASLQSYSAEFSERAASSECDDHNAWSRYRVQAQIMACAYVQIIQCQYSTGADQLIVLGFIPLQGSSQRL